MCLIYKFVDSPYNDRELFSINGKEWTMLTHEMLAPYMELLLRHDLFEGVPAEALPELLNEAVALSSSFGRRRMMRGYS